jgi:hypothetical protein
MSHTEIQRLIDDHFAGTLPPEGERTMRGHLPECDACRTYYGRHLLLARLDPEALSAEQRIGRGLGVRRPVIAERGLGVRSMRVAQAAAAVLLAAAAVLLVVRPGARQATDSGFTSRGGGQLGDVSSHIFVYRVPPGGHPTLASDIVGRSMGLSPIGRSDELAFAYENAAHHSHLAIFGVDEHGHVYWFHPAWSHEGENPEAIDVAQDGERHELPEAVKQPFDGSRLEIHGLYVDRRMTVREVEKLVAAQPRGPLTVPGGIDEVTAFTVNP